MDKLISVLLCILLTTFSLAGCLGDSDNETSDEDDGLSEDIEPEAIDTDADGLGDEEEERRYRTDPLNYDTDGDGVPDGWEVSFGYDPLNGSDGAPRALCEWYDGNETSNPGMEAFCNSIDVDQSEETADSKKYGIHESSTFFTWNRCSPLVDSTLLESSSFYDVFDDSNLDLSVCDSQYQLYEIDSTTSLSLPLQFTIDSYVDTDLLRPNQLPSSWEHDNEWLYNCDEDCYKHAMIADADGQAVKMEGGYYSYNNDVFQYLYDDTTGSGYYIDTIRFFVCNSGEYVNSEEYNDGNFDCEDGSDEDNEDVEMSDLWCNLGEGYEEQVPFDWLNDGIGDCYDGSDEPEGNPSSDDEDEPTPVCGDAIVDGNLGESCDDGNTLDGDGCSSTCQIEPQPICGDGVVDENEQCDDGNTADGDGCSSTCEIEPQPTCGDGVVDVDEQCDDGNTENGDGCDSECVLEDPCTNVECGEGWTCDDGDCILQYFQPENRDELKTAVDEWIANSTAANSTYGNISTWDTSLITDMSELFYYNETFNDDISQWDVSSVVTTEKMFKFAQGFNQDLSGWDVSNVVYMNEMFYYATDFNQDIGHWDVSNVTDMEGMFFAAIDFNQHLVNWNVSKVTDTNGMFHSAISFNGDISQWDTSSVTKINSMFYAASNFNQDISGWDVSGVNDWYGMNSMFYGAESFNQDISSWDVSNVNNMYGMFYNAKSFNQDLSSWNVSGSTNLNAMFEGADDLSDENRCVIHNSFSSSDYWNYDWAEYCSDD